MRNFRKLPSFHKFLLWKKTDSSILKHTAKIYGHGKIQLFNTALLLLFSLTVGAQQSNRERQDRCGTMPRLQLMLNKNQALRTRFETERVSFNRAVQQGTILRLPQSANRVTDQ